MPLTPAERQARRRRRHVAMEEALREILMDARTIAEARAIAARALEYER
jgi:hypothetical protein